MRHECTVPEYKHCQELHINQWRIMALIEGLGKREAGKGSEENEAGEKGERRGKRRWR